MASKKIYRYTALVLACTFIAGGSYFWFAHKNSAPIYLYDPVQDRAALIEIFRQNWFWLTTNPDEQDAVASFEQNLDARSSSNSPFDRGNLTIQVYRVPGAPDHEATKGFIAYHRCSWTSAKILYLVVNEQYRKSGYAKTLMQYALDDLKEQGYARVELLTRLCNVRAQGLYKKFGFKSYWSDDQYITYERTL